MTCNLSLKKNSFNKLMEYAALLCAKYDIESSEYDNNIIKYSSLLDTTILQLTERVLNYRYLMGYKGEKDCSFLTVKTFQKNHNKSIKSLETKIEKKLNVKENDLITIRTISKLDNYDMSKLKIESCFINKVSYTFKNLHTLQNKIYSIINNRIKIMQTSIFKMSRGYIKTKDSHYIKNLDLTVEKSDYNQTIMEIIFQCKDNNIVLDLHLSDENKNIVNIKVY